MLTILRTQEFDKWLNALRDLRGRARIIAGLLAAEQGNFGDCRSVGQGVSEMRVHFGPGYRVYFTRIGEEVHVLLSGGDKSSQSRALVEAAEAKPGKRGPYKRIG